MAGGLGIDHGSLSSTFTTRGGKASNGAEENDCERLNSHVYVIVYVCYVCIWLDVYLSIYSLYFYHLYIK